MSAVILAGGLGTRLRSEVADRPKVLAEVAGHPFLLYLLEPLQRAGLRHVVLCTGHGAAQLAEVLGDRRGLLAIDHSVEDHPLGTGGALRHALPLLPSQTWLVMNGDSFAGLDPAALIAHHRAQGRAATLAVVHRPDTSRFGRVRLGEADRVVGFAEKQAGSGPGWINAGVYVLSRATVAAIAAERAVSLEREVLPRLVDEGLSAFRAPGPFVDIGTPQSFRGAADVLARAGARPLGTRSAVLLDRDGTLIVQEPYLSHPDQVELLPGAAAGLRRMAEAGWRLLVVTNQSGVARGYFDRSAVDAVHRRLEALLAEEGVTLDGIYCCPHHPEAGCGCRKPAVGHPPPAARDPDQDPAPRVVVGDKACDIDLGTGFGSYRVLVRTGYGADVERTGGCRADAVVDDLVQAAAVFERHLDGAPA